MRPLLFYTMIRPAPFTNNSLLKSGSKSKLNFKDEIPPPPDEAMLLRIQGVQPHPRHLKMTESERLASGAFRGVTQRNARSWAAQISYKDAKLYLTVYSTPEAAARAWDSAYFYLHGRWVAVPLSFASALGYSFKPAIVQFVSVLLYH